MFIDSSFVYLMFTYLIYGKYFDGGMSFPIFYGIRSICLNLANWPVPKNFIFTSPGIPSIFISYERANDLYFSGHTGALTIFFFMHFYRKLRKRTYFFFGILIYTVFFLLLNGVHYTNDILIGFIVAFNIITTLNTYRYNFHLSFLKLIAQTIDYLRTQTSKLKEKKDL